MWTDYSDVALALTVLNNVHMKDIFSYMYVAIITMMSGGWGFRCVHVIGCGGYRFRCVHVIVAAGCGCR